jgi:uncharacterized protein
MRSARAGRRSPSSVRSWVEFIARNPEYLDLIDKVHPGSGAYPQHEPAVGQDDDEQLTAFEHDMT